MNQADLRLVVDNLGPIRHADVALRPLTVLIGRNNTGKTYLAQALYAVHKAIDGFPHGRLEKLTDSEHEALLEVLVPHMASEHSESSLQVQDLTDELKARVTDWVHRALKDTGHALNQRLFAYFGVSDLVDITRWGANDLVMKVLQDDDALLFDSKGNVSVDPSAVLSVSIDDEDALGFSAFCKVVNAQRRRSRQRVCPTTTLLDAGFECLARIRKASAAWWDGPLSSCGPVGFVARMDGCSEAASATRERPLRSGQTGLGSGWCCA